MASHVVTHLAFALMVPFLGAVPEAGSRAQPSISLIAADRKECLMKLGHPGNFHCCKDVHSARENTKKDFDPEMFKECFQPPNKPPPSCDTDTCLAKKHGHLNDDGSMNKEAIQSDLEEKMAADPDLVEVIKTKCINGELSDYGPPDMCELRKFRHCAGLQAVLSCKEWDNAGPCSGIKDQIEVCRSVV